MDKPIRNSTPEIWKDIADPKWSEHFEISNRGRLKAKAYVAIDGRIKAERIITAITVRAGKAFYRIIKRIDGFENRGILYVGEAVAKAFLKKPRKLILKWEDETGFNVMKYDYNYVVNINGNIKNNNDWNLMWGTRNDINKLPGDVVEVWKKVSEEFWATYFEVSDMGRFRSIERWVMKKNHTCREPYKEFLPSRIMKFRDNGKCENIMSNFRHKTGNVIHAQKSAYISREVLLAFVAKPKEDLMRFKKLGDKQYVRMDYEYKYSQNIDGDCTNNVKTNIRWATSYDIYLRKLENGMKDKMDLYKHAPRWLQSKNK